MPIELPINKFDLTFQVFDSDLFSKDDYICGARLNLSLIINDVNVYFKYGGYSFENSGY